MLRNDYRRALILLRPLVKGLTGHVRLERRTLAGTMRFTVTGVERGATVQALLMADTGDNWVVYELGALGADSRGETGMIASFDPRNLNGLDLNQYTLVALVSVGAGAPELLMTGMVNGSKEIDWGKARAAAAAAFRTDAAHAPDVKAAQAPPAACCCDADGAPAAQYTESDAPHAEDAPPLEQPAHVHDHVHADAEPEGCAEAEEAAQVEFTAEAEAAPPAEAPPETAAEWLGLSAELEWPDEIAALKALFSAAKVSRAFALEDFVFVDAPLPGEDGSEGLCAIGLKAESGQPVAVCYALPGAYSAEPPPGLEDYRYLGGWWYTVLEVAPGQALGE